MSASRGTADLRFVAYKQVLGAQFRFAGDSHALLDLVEAAYGGLPPQMLPASGTEFRVEMQLLQRNTRAYQLEPPAPQIRLDKDEVSAVIDASNYVVINPALRCAHVVVSEDMLRHAYHLRYELIEFAVFILAARGIGLVPLHGACVGRQGRGLLLLGASGSGKSTLALHCQLQGLDLLAEDAVFVRPADMLATGVPNFLHVRVAALDFVTDHATRCRIRRAPVIRRRSGIEKFEVDLRREPGQLASGPLQLVGAVFVSNQTADTTNNLLEPLSASEVSRVLTASQSYALSQPGWGRFARRLVAGDAYRLRRARHAPDAVDALMRLLD